MDMDFQSNCIMNQLITIVHKVPALITSAGERAAYRFYEFFTAQIRNHNTCRALLERDWVYLIHLCVVISERRSAIFAMTLLCHC